MYLLFVDESGTHGGSHSFVLGGVAVHEQDAAALAKQLERAATRAVAGTRLTADDVELHATELRNAKKPTRPGGSPGSPWAEVPRQSRLALLQEAYRLLGAFRPTMQALPTMLFGVVLDRRFRAEWAPVERERFGYEVLLNKFDVMLKRSHQLTGEMIAGW